MNKNTISTSRFVDLLLATGGDFSRLTDDNINQIMEKAADIKRSAEESARVKAQQRKFFAAQRHKEIMEYIESLVGSNTVFTPTQIQLAEQKMGNIPMPYQFYSAHLQVEIRSPESRIERVFGSIEYRTKRGETKTRKVSSNNHFYKFI